MPSLPPIPHVTDRTAQAVLGHVRSLGYAVSAFNLPASLWGTVPGCVEMHAVDVKTGEQFIAKVIDGEGEEELKCACELAAMVGIDLEG